MRIRRVMSQRAASRRAQSLIRTVVGVAVSWLAVGVVLLAPGPAFASQRVYAQGIAGAPFRLASVGSSVVVSGGTDQSLSLRVGEAWKLGAGSVGYTKLGVSQPDPQSVEVLTNGDVLVADSANDLVAEFLQDGSLVWSYTRADDPGLSAPVCACHLADGDTLICDSGADRVFIVDKSHQKKWQYGTTGIAGSGVDLLKGPTSADELANGNVLICDTGNHRVIEVQYSDYATGFTASSIVWRYGQPGTAGSGADELVKPTSAQVLTAGASQGNMLICDQGAQRVLEIRASDFDSSAPHDGFGASSMVWQYPAAGSSTVLAAPSCAAGVNGSDNLVWIADAGSADVPGRVLGVATNSISGSPSGHQVIADYGPSGGTPFAGTLSAPASLWQTAAGGPLVVAEPGEHRVVAIGTTTALATVTSVKLDCGLAKRKRFVSIRCTFASVPTAQFTVAYQIDKGSLHYFGGTGGQFGGTSVARSSSATKTALFPPQTIGTTITYWISLSAGSASSALTPELQSLAITYAPSHAKSSGKGGGGKSGNRANSNGSASANPSSAGGGSGLGGGIGGGTGSGSGNGAGSGRGSGSANSTAGSNTGTTGTSAAGTKLPAAVSTSQGAASAAAPVSGYAFSYAGRAGGGEGGGASPTSPGLPFAPVGGAVVGVSLLLLVGPWAERRRLRLLVDWDPKLQRPFPAERTRHMPPRS